MKEAGARAVRDAEEAIEPSPDQTKLRNQEEPPAEALRPDNSNCLACDRPDSWDNMIMCDGPHEERWYHLRCVGIQGLPSNGINTISRLDMINFFLLIWPLEDWLCPDCTLQGHTKVEESSSDAKPSHYGRIPKRHSLRRSALSSKKASASLNPKQTPKKHSAPSPSSASSQISRSSREEEQRLLSREQPKSSLNTKKQDKPWTALEKDLVRTLMEEVITEQRVNLTEKKWEVISGRLASRFGFSRSKISIKNYWSRQGRAQTGVDERRHPNPNKLVTSMQNPEQRKRARQQMARALKNKNTEDSEDENSGLSDRSGEQPSDEGEADDDDEGGPPTKRRRNR